MELRILFPQANTAFFIPLGKDEGNERSLLPPGPFLLRCFPADAALLYEGTVWHERRCPVRHSFRYPVKYALIDLDATPRPLDGHLSPADARQFACTDGRVLLLTIPPSVGYEQNPLSLYYCYSLKGGTQHLEKCIAEVTSTPWGERVLFAFNPNSDVVAKPLHVGPFMDMLGNWTIKANAPGDDLSVCISVQHPELGNYFTATLNIKRVSSPEATKCYSG